MAVLFTNPFETAKVRHQMDGELRRHTSGVYRGTLGTLRLLIQREGWAGAQAGLSAAVIREATKNLFRIGAYEPILDAIHGSSRG